MFQTPEAAKLKPAPRAKKFYTLASTAQAAEGGWQVLLDGKVLKTAGKGALLLPTQKLAEAVAAEWNAQDKEIIPESMKQMQFACAALDYVAAFRADVEAETLGYAETDLLCYQADEPEELAARLRSEWTPMLDWVSETYGAKPKLAGGLMPVAQEPKLAEAFAKVVAALPIFTLTALWLVTKHTASLMLSLAVLHGKISTEDAIRLSQLEEQFQNEKWGEDEEARNARLAVAEDMTALGQFLQNIHS